MTTGKEGEVGDAEQRTDTNTALLAGWNRPCEEQKRLHARNTSVLHGAEAASLTFLPQRPSQSKLTPQREMNTINITSLFFFIIFFLLSVKMIEIGEEQCY